MTTIDDTQVLPAYRNPPTPTLTFDGPVATLTGVRWVWNDRCWSCHEMMYVTADGGTITVGISHYRSHSGKTDVTKWFEREKPARPATLPTVCGHCGQDRPFASTQGFHQGWSRGRPHGHMAALNEAWTTIRARYPEMVTMADDTMRTAQMRANRRAGRA